MRKILLSLWCALWLVPAFAVQVNALDSHVKLDTDIQILEDRRGDYSIEQIRGSELSQHFRPVSIQGSDLNFGFTPSTYWIRIPLQRASNVSPDWLLELSYAKLSTLELYPPNAMPVFTGSDMPIASRPVSDRFFVFPVQLDTQVGYFYIKVRSNYSLTIPLDLWRPNAFNLHQQHILVAQCLYYGGLLSLALYNLLMYLSLRDRRFLWYSLYALNFGLGMLAGNGYGRQFIWTESAVFDDLSQSFFLGISAVCAIHFGRQFLQTRQRMPRIDWLLLGSGAVFLAIPFGLLASIYLDISVQHLNELLMFNSLIMAVLIVHAGVKVLRSGERGARFFVLAWSVLWLGAVLAALRAFGWLPTNSVTSYILQISSGFEMLLLSLALADVIHVERRKRESFQRQASQAKQRMIDMLQSSEERLERIVQERTQQLKNSLDHQEDMLRQYVRFGSLISHEFRNPMAIISSQLRVIHKEHDLGVDQVQKRLGIIDSAVQRLVRLFDKWLQSDRLKGDLKNLNCSEIIVEDWLSQFAEQNRYQFADHTVLMQLMPAKQKIWVDTGLLEIALSNLVENACKYSPDQSPILLETRERPDYVGIAVTDQGKGISSEFHEKIFNEFFRMTAEGGVPGIGLGLAIVQRIVKAHGGHIELDSALERGSCFCIWLPRRLFGGFAPSSPAATLPVH